MELRKNEANIDSSYLRILDQPIRLRYQHKYIANTELDKTRLYIMNYTDLSSSFVATEYCTTIAQ